jgi:hypothetical protein
LYISKGHFEVHYYFLSLLKVFGIPQMKVICIISSVVE